MNTTATLRSPAASIHPSNLLTYASLASGVCAIAAAQAGSAQVTGALLALAALADTFDGRFARRFARSSEEEALGGQLDSLSDAVTFGLAPVVCAALLGESRAGVLWWSAAGMYVFAAVTRLGFYNVSQATVSGFIGLPAPVAALIWSSAFLLHPDIGVATAIALSCGIAMIAPLPMPRPRGIGLVAFACWPVGLVIAHVAMAVL